MRYTGLLLGIIALCAVCADAQENVAANAPVPSGEEAKPEGGAEQAPPVALAEGDRIIMKSGKVLAGVQVVKATPTDYEVRVVEGVEPLRIPRGLVDHVEYDNIEPPRTSKELPSFIDGQEVSTPMFRRLTSALSDTPLKYRDMNFVDILKNLGEVVGVTVGFSEKALGDPAKPRTWSLETKPDTTLLSVLRQDLPRKFADLVVVFQYDKVYIATKEEAEKMRAPAEPPAAEKKEEQPKPPVQSPTSSSESPQSPVLSPKQESTQAVPFTQAELVENTDAESLPCRITVGKIDRLWNAAIVTVKIDWRQSFQLNDKESLTMVFLFEDDPKTPIPLAPALLSLPSRQTFSVQISEGGLSRFISELHVDDPSEDNGWRYGGALIDFRHGADASAKDKPLSIDFRKPGTYTFTVPLGEEPAAKVAGKGILKIGLFHSREENAQNAIKAEAIADAGAAIAIGFLNQNRYTQVSDVATQPVDFTMGVKPQSETAPDPDDLPFVIQEK